MSAEVIRIVGARQNNLKDLSLDLPLHELIVITGVSGSGKSSLAFDTLYAEGQRRYVETFSAYARQFLERMDKPEADRIEGIPPALANDLAKGTRFLIAFPLSAGATDPEHVRRELIRLGFPRVFHEGKVCDLR